MLYEDLDRETVEQMLERVGSLAFEQAEILTRLEAGTPEAELAQIRTYLELLTSGASLSMKLGAIVALGRTDDDGFRNTYFDQGDIVAEVVEGLSALLLTMYPIAAPTINFDSENDNNWVLTIELAVCRKAAVAMRNVCELSDQDLPGNEGGVLSTRTLQAVEPVYSLINQVFGPDESQDCEVFGCVEVVMGWVNVSS